MSRTLAALLAALVGIAPGAAVPAPEATPAEVSVTVIPQSSGALKPDDALRVSVVVTNDGAGTVTETTASLYLNRSPIGTSDLLNSWFAPDGDSPAPSGVGLAEVPLGPVGPGETARASFEVDAAKLGLGSTWGVRPLWVTVDVGGAPAIGRSAIVWKPDGGSPAARLAMAMPLTVPPTASGLIPADDLEAYTAPFGLLTRQLDAVQGTSVAIGIDPMILASIRVLGTNAPQSALDWLERLRGLRNETFPLGYADADVSTMAQANGEVLAPQSFAFALGAPLVEPDSADGETPTSTPTGSPPPEAPVTDETVLDWNYTFGSLAWPYRNTVVADDLPVFAEAGHDTLILDAANLRASGPGSLLRVGEMSVLASLPGLTDMLRESANAVTGNDFAAASAQLSAALAVLAAESGERALFATLGRSNPSGDSRARQTLALLDSLDWVRMVPLSAALDGPAVSATIVDKPVSGERIEQAQRLLELEQLEHAFATVADDPVQITAERRLRVLALLGNAWRYEPEQWAEQVEGFESESQALRTSVCVVETSQINVFSDRETLPIYVGNSLDVPVTVYATVRPDSPQLAVRATNVEITIEPQSTSRQFIVPVQSVANGQVDITITLTSRTGVHVCTAERVTVNVQAGWETFGTIVIGLAVLALLGVGIFRTARRRRAVTVGADEKVVFEGRASGADTNADSDVPESGKDADE